MAKKIGVVYTPLVDTEKAKIVAPSKIDIPQYADKGVAYTGFSKILYSGNNYELSQQYPEDINAVVNCNGGETGFLLTPSYYQIKDFYCKKILIYIYNKGGIGGQYIVISDGGEARLIIMENILIPFNSFDLNFSEPLKFSKENRIRVSSSINRIAGEVLIFNFYGWSEK